MEYRTVRLPAEGRWPADVEVWHVAMPPSECDVDRSILDDAEIGRATLFRHSADRVRFMATRGALRSLLGGRLGVQPAEVRFAVGRRGRPELANASRKFSFNVSHSGEHALISISGIRTVGIDVERIDPTLDWKALVDLVCTDREARMLRAESAALQREHFCRCWTAKEALLKALGVGIAEDLRAFEVAPAGNGVQQPVVTGGGVFADAAALRYCWLTDLSGYVGCVAFSGPAGLSIA